LFDSTVERYNSRRLPGSRFYSRIDSSLDELMVVDRFR